jgi:hypothetical protein
VVNGNVQVKKLYFYKLYIFLGRYFALVEIQIFVCIILKYYDIEILSKTTPNFNNIGFLKPNNDISIKIKKKF